MMAHGNPNKKTGKHYGSKGRVKRNMPKNRKGRRK